MRVFQRALSELLKRLSVAWSLCVLLAAGNAAGADTVDGPIRVSADNRHFEHTKGKPFFWLADTAWALVVKLSAKQADAYFGNRAQKGFTVVQTVLAWGNGSGSELKLPLPNAAGDKVWLNDDPSTPNEAYFKHVDGL